VPPLNRVVYEGATNTKITCESNSPSVCWQFYPFAYAQSYDYRVVIVFYQVVASPFHASFGIDQSQGTEVLVVFNATLTPSPIVSTAGFYKCIDYDDEFTAHLVVVRKYELPYFNNVNFLNIQCLRQLYNLRRDIGPMDQHAITH